MKKYKKFLSSILVANFLLAALPGFYILRASALPDSGLPAAQLDIVDFNSDFAARAFQADPKILEMRQVYAGSGDPQFKNIYKIKTTYALPELQAKYGSTLVYAEADHQVIAAAVAVNDPGYTLDANNLDRQWGLVKAHFLDAWDKTKGSSGVVAAIIDTGIDGTHEDLSQGQVGAGYDFIAGAPIDPHADSDDNGHGTLIAGIIGGTANNFRGIVGIDWNISLMPLKALDQSGSGDSADIAAAIKYAADHGANIINLSLGGVGFANDTTLSNAIAYAYARNVVIVAAAGNDVAKTGGDLDAKPVFPICDDDGQNMVIGVAATDQNDQKAEFSNYGKNCVDVSAPGKHILSTINHEPRTGAAYPNGYAYASGTSLAVPFVSGEAALIKSLYPQATNQEIRDRIINSTDPIDAANPVQCSGGSCAGEIGKGRINAFAALDPNLSLTVADGSLVQNADNNVLYFISGGQKHQVSNFVQTQRFSSAQIRTLPGYVLDPIPTGAFAVPLDGTLVKSAQDPTVYEIVSGFKRPVTLQIWQQRKFQAQQVSILSGAEISSWVTGKFLPPLDGTLVKSRKSSTIYWVIDGLLHPMNRAFFLSRGLNTFPVVTLNGNDLAGYAQGAAYIR